MVTGAGRAALYASILRGGQQFTSVFLRHEGILRAFVRDEVKTLLAIIAPLQKAFRQLQAMCDHANEHRSLLILKDAPALKKSLDTLAIKIRKILMENEKENEIVIGRIRHRDVTGKEIKPEALRPPPPVDPEGEEAGE